MDRQSHQPWVGPYWVDHTGFAVVECKMASAASTAHRTVTSSLSHHSLAAAGKHHQNFVVWGGHLHYRIAVSIVQTANKNTGSELGARTRGMQFF